MRQHKSHSLVCWLQHLLSSSKIRWLTLFLAHKTYSRCAKEPYSLSSHAKDREKTIYSLERRLLTIFAQKKTTYCTVFAQNKIIYCLCVKEDHLLYWCERRPLSLFMQKKTTYSLHEKEDHLLSSCERAPRPIFMRKKTTYSLHAKEDNWLFLSEGRLL